MSRLPIGYLPLTPPAESSLCLKPILILSILQMINHNLIVHLSYPLSLEEIADLHKIHSHVLNFLQKLLFQVPEKLGCHFGLTSLRIYS